MGNSAERVAHSETDEAPVAPFATVGGAGGARATESDIMATQEPGRREKPRRDYLTVSEVADLFHVSSKTVVRWANDGKLPYMATLGGHRRFPRGPIEAMVDDQKRGMVNLV